MPALIKLLGKQSPVLASPSVRDKVLPACGMDLTAHAMPIDNLVYAHYGLTETEIRIV